MRPLGKRMKKADSMLTSSFTMPQLVEMMVNKLFVGDERVGCRKRLYLTLLLFAFVHLLTSTSSAAPTASDKFHSSDAVREVSGPFQVRRVTTDLAVVGRHVVGDVTVEIEAQQGVDLLVQWATLVTPSSWSAYDVQRSQQQQQRSDSSSTAGNSNTSVEFQQSSSAVFHRYTVPIVGDSWCSIQETSWLSADNSRKHLISSINCRRLPPAEIGNNWSPQVVVTVRALDGSVQYQRQLSNNRINDPSRSCFKWYIPNADQTLSRTKIVRSGEAIMLNFSAVVQCNETLSSMRLSWLSNNAPVSLDWTATMKFFDAVGNASATLACAFHPTFVQNVNWTDSQLADVGCLISSLPDNGGYLYSIYVAIKSADRRYHSGTFSVSISSDENSSETVTTFIDLLVLDADMAPSILNGKSPNAVEIADSILESSSMRLRSCSDGTSGPWWFGDRNLNRTRDIMLRSSVPDCIICVAEWYSSKFNTVEHRTLSDPPEVRITRSDGLILGSEESHSVYWYQEPGGRGSVSVLLLRAPTDEYTGDYVCTTIPPSTKMASLKSSRGMKHTEGIDHRKDFVTQIKFKLNVQ